MRGEGIQKNWFGRESGLREPSRNTIGIPMVAVVKANPELLDVRYSRPRRVGERFEQVLVDKGFDPDAVQVLSRISDDTHFGKPYYIGTGTTQLLLQGDPLLSDSINFSELVSRYPFKGSVEPTYRGTPDENLVIDHALSDHRDIPGFNKRTAGGLGAMRFVHISDSARYARRALAHDIPVTIIGGGPAGLMVTAALKSFGFYDTTVIDSGGRYKGIWNNPNVAEGSINNPGPFTFNGHSLPAAPGEASKVVKFLSGIERFGTEGLQLPPVVHGRVTEVIPGDLDHAVIYQQGGEERVRHSAIVINAIGNGVPLHPNREGHMTTNTPEKAGKRWQEILTDKKAERLRGKRLVFVGLGNSTAEMLTQVQELNTKGYGIDYRVLTHYPKEAVDNPTETVIRDGTEYRVFRDLTVPRLTKYEGDLPEAYRAYFEALNTGKIIADVAHWDSDGSTIGWRDRSGRQTGSYAFDQQYTLIGTGNRPETLEAMGMHVTDGYLGSIATDYDGEVQRNPGELGRDRVYPGYYGLGAVLRSTHDPNAVVMPGIMHRMHDLLYGVTLRAAEYAYMK